ncbi:MAG: TRAP transporter large permease subunit [Acidiferrobacterales bacterium]|nr:TRAP transporter large permease subunit [Acidiferrobacterales bacterium]
MIALLTTPEFLCAALFVSVIVLLLFGFPVAFSLAGASLLFAFVAAAFGLFDLAYISALPQRIFSIMRNEVLVAVPLFVFMGVTLEKSKIAEELLDNMGRLFGSIRGGLGYSVCIVGALLAASTGIVGATVVTMGLLSLPTMLRRGYSPSFACGSICASGTLGQVIPPSIVLVLLGDQLSTAFQQAQFSKGNFSPAALSVNDLFAGALIPGLVLVGMYIIYQIFIAITRPDACPAVPRDEITTLEDKTMLRTMVSTLFAPLALIVAVLGSILAGLASPTESAAMGGIGALMMAGYKVDPGRGRLIATGAICLAVMLLITLLFDLRMQRQTLTAMEWTAVFVALVCALGLVLGILTAILRVYGTRDRKGDSILPQIMQQTLIVSTMVFVILIGASMFSLVFRGLNGDEVVEAVLHNLPGGTLTVLLLVMLVMFLLGFILDFLEIIFIVVPIVGPVLLQMEIAPGVPMNPVWLGVMMAVNIQTSFLTPPFGFSLFYLRGVAPSSVQTMQIYKGVIPFVLIQLLMLVALWFFPALATWLPSAIFGP